jgi:hypothetical protein
MSPYQPPQRSSMVPLTDIEAKHAMRRLMGRSLGGVRHPDAATENLIFVLCRLIDKAIREYEDARAALEDWLPTNPARKEYPEYDLMRCVDAFENCVDSIKRASRLAEKLKTKGVVTSGDLRSISAAMKQVHRIRNFVEHGEGDLAGAANLERIQVVPAEDAVEASERDGTLVQLTYADLAHTIRTFDVLAKRIAP